MKKKHWSDKISVRLFNGLLNYFRIPIWRADILFKMPKDNLRKIKLSDWLKIRRVGKVTTLELQKLIGKFADEPNQSKHKS